MDKAISSNIFSINKKNITREKLLEILKHHGVVVIKNYFSKSVCDNYMKCIVEWMISKSDNLTMDYKTWIGKNLFNGPRVGMMQALISHCPVIWEIRKKMYPIFKLIWNSDDLITSIDGATIFPPKKIRKTNDWPHLDQTLIEPNCICYQGEVALTNTTAAFKCSPGSHKIHKKILQICNVKPNNTHWLKFNKLQIEKVKEEVIRNNGLWQIPVYCPAGSIILWKSTTIHSAQRITKIPKPIQTDKWYGWRGVVYVCMRPKKHFSNKELLVIKNAAIKGRTTNHWATKIFPKNSRYKIDRGENLNLLHEHPEKLTFNLCSLLRNLVNNL